MPMSNYMIDLTNVRRSFNYGHNLNDSFSLYACVYARARARDRSLKLEDSKEIGG